MLLVVPAETRCRRSSNSLFTPCWVLGLKILLLPRNVVTRRLRFHPREWAWIWTRFNLKITLVFWEMTDRTWHVYSTQTLEVKKKYKKSSITCCVSTAAVNVQSWRMKRTLGSKAAMYRRIQILRNEVTVLLTAVTRNCFSSLNILTWEVLIVSHNKLLFENFFERNTEGDRSSKELATVSQGKQY